MSNIKIIMTYSVSLGILPFLIMLSPLGQSIYAASAHTSGYNHGCSDAQISDSSERYINQPEKGPSFHTNEFMNSYHEGFNACLGSERDNSGSSRHSTSSNPGEVTIDGNTYTKAFWNDYKNGYATGITDYNRYLDQSHDFSCPYKNIVSDSKWCKGYAIAYETSD